MTAGDGKVVIKVEEGKTKRDHGEWGAVRRKEGRCCSSHVEKKEPGPPRVPGAVSRAPQRRGKPLKAEWVVARRKCHEKKPTPERGKAPPAKSLRPRKC